MKQIKYKKITNNLTTKKDYEYLTTTTVQLLNKTHPDKCLSATRRTLFKDSLNTCQATK